MSNEVTSPFTVFFDRSGDPLDAGYIYIGTAGINPETSPISVYWDSSLTTSAAQPIRTLAGYPSQSGSPGRIFINQVSYSIVIKDRNGTLVFSNLNASQFHNDLGNFYVDFYGALGNGTTDDTTAIQAAYTACRLNGGGSVWFTPAKTYIVSQSIVMGSNTVTRLNGATVRAKNPGYVGTVANNNYQLFRNYNFTAASLTDADIYLQGPGTLDFNNVAIVGGGAHLFSCRMTSRVGVRDVLFQNGENGTALLACIDTITDHCVGRNLTNCHFDHWDGAGRCTVVYCRAENDNGVTSAQGIQFTGTGTFLENRSSLDCVVIGNYVKGIRSGGVASALISNANDADSTTYRWRSSLNVVEDCDLGLVWSGEGGQHISDGDTFIDVDGLPIFMQITDSDTPDNCTVINPHLIDCDHAPVNIALIAIGGTGNSVRGVKITNTGAAAYNLIGWFTSTASNCLIEIYDGSDGGGGRFQNDGTNCRVIDRFRRYEEGTYTPALAFGGAAVGMTYGTRSGAYTRLGDTVFVTGVVTLTAKGSSTGTAGLSIPASIPGSATDAPGAGVVPYCANMVGLTSHIALGMAAGGGGFTMRDCGATGTAELDDTNFANNSVFNFSATYKAVS